MTDFKDAQSAATGNPSTRQGVLSGTIVELEIKRGYGYIKSDDGRFVKFRVKDLPVNIIDGRKKLDVRRDDRVTFTVAQRAPDKETHYRGGKPVTLIAEKKSIQLITEGRLEPSTSHVNLVVSHFDNDKKEWVLHPEVNGNAMKSISIFVNTDRDAALLDGYGIHKLAKYGLSEGDLLKGISIKDGKILPKGNTPPRPAGTDGGAVNYNTPPKTKREP